MQRTLPIKSRFSASTKPKTQKQSRKFLHFKKGKKTNKTTTKTNKTTNSPQNNPLSSPISPYTLKQSTMSTIPLPSYLTFSPSFSPPGTTSHSRKVLYQALNKTNINSLENHSLSDPSPREDSGHFDPNQATGLFQTISNTELFYPSSFTPEDIALVERYSRQQITTFGIKHLMAYGQPKLSNAISSAAFLYKELPARYAQRIELLRDFPFEVNRHPLLHQLQAHYLHSLKLITSIESVPTTIDDLHMFNKILLQLVYQSSLLPSSTLSHALCTAFGDVLLQQLMLGSTAEVTKDSFVISPTNQEPEFVFDEKLRNTSLIKPQPTTIATIVADNDQSLTIFNSVLQETLDSFNVARFDTRLLMTQNLQYCQQLFKYLNIECDYPLIVDSLAPAGHDEFGLVVGDNIDYFKNLREHGVDRVHYSDLFDTATSHSTTTTSHSGAANNNNNNNNNNTKTNTATPLPMNSAGQTFSLKEGYDGFIGIIETKLNFPKVIAQVASYAAHQAATRYAVHTLERSFMKRRNFRLGLDSEGNVLDHSGPVFDKSLENWDQNAQGAQNEDHGENQIDKNENNHDEGSDFEPLGEDNADQELTTSKSSKYKTHKKHQTAQKKLEKRAKSDTDGHSPNKISFFKSSILPLSNPNIPPELLISENELEAKFTKFCDDLLELDRNWSHNASQILSSQLEKQRGKKHPKIPNYTTAVLELPPLEIDVPAEFYTPRHKQNRDKKGPKLEPNNIIHPDGQDKPTTTTILIPFPKIRLAGHLDHTILFSRPHANLVVRELLSNSIEKTLKTTFELTKTTTKHLVKKDLKPQLDLYKIDGVNFDHNHKNNQDINPNVRQLIDDLVTGGLFPEDYTIMNIHAHIPPIEVWCTSASSAGRPKKQTETDKIDDSITFTSKPQFSPSSFSPQPDDDIYSLKFADRANGLSAHRAEAVLTYGNALLQHNLNQVRTYRSQQAALDQYNQHCELLRSLYYEQYNINPISGEPMGKEHHEGVLSRLPFIPPPLPQHLQPENLITINIPTADHYGPTALADLCGNGQGHTPRGFGLPLAKATVSYLHGELKLNSIDGFGTDVYVRLKV